MDEIYTRLISLPTTVRGYTVRDRNGDFNIYINDRISREAMAETYRHELKHIRQGDFQKSASVNLIEVYAHK